MDSYFIKQESKKRKLEQINVQTNLHVPPPHDNTPAEPPTNISPTKTNATTSGSSKKQQTATGAPRMSTGIDIGM